VATVILLPGYVIVNSIYPFWKMFCEILQSELGNEFFGSPRDVGHSTGMQGSGYFQYIHSNIITRICYREFNISILENVL
jgi:hypothetical protein